MVLASVAVSQQLSTVVASAAVAGHLAVGQLSAQSLLVACALLLAAGECVCCVVLCCVL